MAAVASRDRAQDLRLVRELRGIGVAEPGPEIGVGIDLAYLDGTSEHTRDDRTQVVRGEATGRHQFVGRPGMALAISQYRAGDVGDITEVDHRLSPVQSPGQLEHAPLER